jgi:hypothetical protein
VLEIRQEKHSFSKPLGDLKPVSFMDECVGGFTADNPFNNEWKIFNGPTQRQVFKNEFVLYKKHIMFIST